MEWFSRQTNGPSRDCLTDSWALWLAWRRGSIEEDVGSGPAVGTEERNSVTSLWLPVIGRPRHTPHPGSKAPRGDPYLLQSVSHEVTARSGQPPCVSWVLIHLKSMAASGPCLWLRLFGTPFPLTVPVAHSSVPQNPGDPSSDMPLRPPSQKRPHRSPPRGQVSFSAEFSQVVTVLFLFLDSWVSLPP